MKLLHTLLAALLVLPLSLRAQTETLDSIYQFHHPSKVTCTRHGNDVDITLVTGITNTTKQFNFKCSSLRSTPMTASGNSTVSYTFSTPSEVVLKNKADLFRLCIRCNEADEDYAFTMTGMKLIAPSDSTIDATMVNIPDETFDSEFNNSWTSRISFKKRINGKISRNRFGHGLFRIGFVTPLGAPSEMETDMSTSYEIGFEPLRYTHFLPSGKQSFGIGIEFNWRNYRMTGNSRFFRADNDNNLTIAPYPTEVSDIQSSRIKTFSVGIPFTFTFRLPHDWFIDLRPTLRFNTHASAKSFYKIADLEEHVTHHVEEAYNDIHQQKVSVDFTAQVHWRWLGLYATYSPCKVINKAYGPQFSTFTTGFSLFY